MAEKPEESARAKIHRLLAAAGWAVQLCADANIAANKPRTLISYTSRALARPNNGCFVWYMMRDNRKFSRKVSGGNHAVYSDAPDTTRAEDNVARREAIDMPMLIKQNGLEERGWRGTPFYRSVIWAPQNVQTAIFAHETAP